MVRADRDYYDVPGVPRGAGAEEIQRAYRQLARRNHPDVNPDPGAEDRFKDITEAYDTLSNPDSRRRYHRFGPQWRQAPEDFDTTADPYRQRAGAAEDCPTRTDAVGMDDARVISTPSYR
jgi:curved DNA-binding protein